MGLKTLKEAVQEKYSHFPPDIMSLFDIYNFRQPYLELQFEDWRVSHSLQKIRSPLRALRKGSALIVSWLHSLPFDVYAFYLLSEITLNSSVFDVKYISNSYIIRSNVLTFWRGGVQESHPVFRILWLLVLQSSKSTLLGQRSWELHLYFQLRVELPLSK